MYRLAAGNRPAHARGAGRRGSTAVTTAARQAGDRYDPEMKKITPAKVKAATRLALLRVGRHVSSVQLEGFRSAFELPGAWSLAEERLCPLFTRIRRQQICPLRNRAPAHHRTGPSVPGVRRIQGLVNVLVVTAPVSARRDPGRLRQLRRTARRLASGQGIRTFQDRGTTTN